MNPPSSPATAAAPHRKAQETATVPASAPTDRPLSLTRAGAVLHVRLTPAGPDSVLNSAVLDALTTVLDDLHDQPDIRILVLSSLGDDFCLGADRQEFQNALHGDPTGAALRRIAGKAERVCRALEDSPAVTIARLHGRVIGAGLALAAYCDLRAGADDTRFRMPEVGIGLAPAWGGAMGRLITEAGASRIRELMLTCDDFDASTAHQLGLLHKVAPLDALDDTITAWTRPLSRRSPGALHLTKRMLTGFARAARTSDTALLDAHLLAAQLAQPSR
ncbi:enoyl-CoA hydratase/isomerase family protein [Streptomyces sp. NPDC090106]|uniref:enoyl-CoA hydratase/isomerase family protein n=1 Tax=Streptomyces sp. NPDC090106 TaxID=3365946 RepID=UPI003823537E